MAYPWAIMNTHADLTPLHLSVLIPDYLMEPVINGADLSHHWFRYWSGARSVDLNDMSIHNLDHQGFS